VRPLPGGRGPRAQVLPELRNRLDEQRTATRPTPPVVQALLMHHTDDARAAWFHLGAALLNENRPDEARSALDRARSEPGATPTNADIGVLRAWAAEESGEPSVALQAYLDAALLDPALAGDILPTAQGLLSTDEATMLVPWLRSTWLPKMQAASSLDIRSLAPFQVRVSLLTGNVGDAVAAVADAVDAGTGTHPVAVADELRAVPDAPCPEAEWRLLIGLALERLGEHADALRFVHEAQQLQLPDEGPLGIAESLVAEADQYARTRVRGCSHQTL
jgi:tetratricopeptide (TPR) repeat protein